MLKIGIFCCNIRKYSYVFRIVINFLLMKMFVFNSKREESPVLGLLKGVFFSLRFMGDKTKQNLKSKMPYFGGLRFKVLCDIIEYEH